MFNYELLHELGVFETLNHIRYAQLAMYGNIHMLGQSMVCYINANPN